MPVKKCLTAVLAGVVMLLLITDGQAALQSASQGVDLCLRTVIPSLFPFLFLCSLITSSLWGERIPWLRFPSKKLGIPKGGESLLISAFLGGYPAGAEVVGRLYQQGQLSRQDAQHLLPLCNNAGPAFLFGMVATQFPKMEMVAALWLIQILSVFLASALSAGSMETSVSLSGDPPSISEILNRSVKTMACICGWIILFQILCGFMDRWFLWHFSMDVQIFIKGIMELSSGCCELNKIGSLALRFLICAVMLSLGGICVTMQTASVMGKLSLARYLHTKLLHCTAAVVLSVLYLRWGWLFLAGAGGMILLLPMHQKNKCSISAVCDV